jgi:hypothetical protein
MPMGARERTTSFELTLKGSEELEKRTYRLDAKVRNILFLIQKGQPTIEGILENSIFPREDVLERLRELLRGHFITAQIIESAPAGPTTMPRRTDPNTVSGPAAPAPEPEPEQAEAPPVVYFGL